MTTTYVLDQDAYGGYARASHLADVLEHLCVVLGQSPNEANVRDWIEDAGWTLASDEAIDTPMASAASADPAARVFALLRERASVLGERYPFLLRNSRLHTRKATDASATPYAGLLAICLAHGYGLCTKPDPTRIFEATVADVLRGRGLLTADTGNGRRSASSFEELIERVGGVLGILPTPEAATSRLRAQEEGVDAAAVFSWGDMRRGRWLFLGQATCGKSETWRTKAADVADGLWMRALDEVVVPLVFLALPFHVEPKHFRYLVELRSARMSILDRLRLARYKDTLSDDERSVAAAVFSTRPEWG